MGDNYLSNFKRFCFVKWDFCIVSFKIILKFGFGRKEGYKVVLFFFWFIWECFGIE